MWFLETQNKLPSNFSLGWFYILDLSKKRESQSFFISAVDLTLNLFCKCVLGQDRLH